MKTFDFQQGSTEWANARMGVITASEADNLVTPLFKLRTGQGPETYLYKKLSEKILGYSMDSAGGFAVDQGQLVETIALPWYSFTFEVPVKRVGFCLSDDGRTGCSPDGLLEDGTGLEIKSPQGHTHLKYYFEKELPAEYRAQVHFSMYVTGAPHWTFVSFHRQLPPLVVKVTRDDKIIAAIDEAVSIFTKSFDERYSVIKGIKDAELAAQAAAYRDRGDAPDRSA